MTSSAAPRSSSTPSLLITLLILALAASLAAIGTGFASEALQGWSLVRDAPSFEAIPGTIIHARTRSEGQDQVPDVAFRYHLQGRAYEGDNHAVASSYRDARLASREANRYRANQKVTVYVDPRDPSRSSLSRQVPTARSAVRTAYALLFYGIALFVLFTLWRSRKRARVLAHAKAIGQERARELERRRSERLEG